MRDSENAISIANLTKFYGRTQALDNISFTVKRGDFLAFLGPNGAGKTTTINIITGLSNYQSGTVKVFGHDVTKDYRNARRLIGLCTQDFNFDPFLNIFQLLVYQAGYFGIHSEDAKQRAREILKRFQLWDKAEVRYRALSGGMKKRLLLCRALIHEPEILILDEPTAGCDLELKFLIWDHLAQLNKEGKTIFLTTHYMEEAERLTKTIGIIDHGRMMCLGPKEEVLRNKSLQDVFMEITGIE
ncbi:MAG: ABC transporter ATP-binding protein [Candidatus Omnitrophica bacterium]|nr:ABC transporter ATP-binding protein [Candidatus Omnitrophota bacterium]